MPRFFSSQKLEQNKLITLSDALVRHIHVLRLQPGNIITLFDGLGGEYAATLTQIEKRSATAVVTGFLPTGMELPYAITLAQGLPETSKMDWIIEKAVELGVTTIQPIAAQRSVTRLDSAREEKKRQHWEAIVIAASEQCGRNQLARIAPLADLRVWLQATASAQAPAHSSIMLSPRGTRTLPDWLQGRTPGPVNVLIGPEGGFSDTEESMAVAQGVELITLGARILRTETAGLAVAAMVNGHWDR